MEVVFKEGMLYVRGNKFGKVSVYKDDVLSAGLYSTELIDDSLY